MPSKRTLLAVCICSAFLFFAGCATVDDTPYPENGTVDEQVQWEENHSLEEQQAAFDKINARRKAEQDKEFAEQQAAMEQQTAKDKAEIDEWLAEQEKQTEEWLKQQKEYDKQLAEEMARLEKAIVEQERQAAALYAQNLLPERPTPLIEPVVSSIEAAAEWVHSNVRYDFAKARNDDFFLLSPKQVLAAHSGVCRDMVVLTLKIVYDSLGIKPSFVAIDIPATPGHAIIEFNGRYFDPTNLLVYKRENIRITRTYKYDEIMSYIARQL